MDMVQMELGPDEIQMELDQMSPAKLQKRVDDMRAGEKTLEALKQGSSAGDKTLEALMTSLQQMADEIRAGDGPLEARTGETAGDGTPR